jgi:hypothetical protein
MAKRILDYAHVVGKSENDEFTSWYIDWCAERLCGGECWVIRPYVVKLLSDPSGILNASTLDNMDICDHRLWSLIEDCCNFSIPKARRALIMFRHGVFTREQIHTNLDSPLPVPFIDDLVIKIKDIPPYGEYFGLSHPKWYEWCRAQRDLFESRTESYNKWFKENYERRNAWKKERGSLVTKEEEIWSTLKKSRS